VVPSGPKSEIVLVLPEVRPVGDYAWMDERRVALYVPGDRGQPATLRIADTTTGTSELVASVVGRSIERTPGGDISFVQLNGVTDGAGQAAVIRKLFSARRVEQAVDATPAGIADLVRPAAGLQDPFLAWTPDGTLLMAGGSTLYAWRPGEHDWTVLANLGRSGIRNVTRLAVSPQGDRLAFVAEVR
jgi:hypothetical protein